MNCTFDRNWRYCHGPRVFKPFRELHQHLAIFSGYLGESSVYHGFGSDGYSPLRDAPQASTHTRGGATPKSLSRPRQTAEVASSPNKLFSIANDRLMVWRRTRLVTTTGIAVQKAPWEATVNRGCALACNQASSLHDNRKHQVERPAGASNFKILDACCSNEKLACT
jgi:hypothetical protein